MDEGKGILFAFIAAVVSGISVFVNGFAVKGFEPIAFAALKGAAVAIMLIAAIFMFKEREKLLKLPPSQWGWLALIGIVGGSVPFVLFFQGLSMIPAIKGSFLFRLLFIFSAIFAMLILKERLSKKAALGAGIALFGNALLLGNENILSFGAGEALVLAATAIWGFEYVLSKWVINSRHIEPRLVGFGRMFFGMLAIFAYLAAIGKLSTISTLSFVHWEWVAITSIFLFFFVSSWYVSLKYAKATVATAILTLGGPISAALNYFFLGKAPTIMDGAGLLLITLGIFAIVGYGQMARLPESAINELRKLNAWKA
ncbi:MAG: DMT family transporter [Candidatus Micrarchaeota archaeon]